MAKLNVPVPKGKGTVEIDTDLIVNEAVFREVVLQGLKVLVNRGMSKVTKTEYPDADELKAKAMEIATKWAAALQSEEAEGIKLTGGAKKSGVTGAVKTEAMRLARNVVKDELKKAGIKISHVEASEITKAARALLDQDPELIEMAKANIEARSKVPVEGKIDVKAIPISAKKKAAADKKAADAKASKQLSAKQAGKVEPRAKGGKGKGAAQANA